MTKEYDESDELIKKEIIKKYSLKYSKFMSKVYSILKTSMTS